MATAATAAATAAASQQAAQSGLVSAMAPVLTAAWLHLDAENMKATLPDFSARIAALVHHFSPASATLAVRFYRERRRAAGITDSFTPRPADPPPLQQISKTVDWATKDLWQARESTPDARAKLETAARTKVAGAVDKLVLDVGRNTILDNVAADRKAKAWARVPEPGACYFCALLATRGAVYSEKTAGFKTHDHCRCHPEPVFTAYEPTAQIREWQALYADATGGIYGMDNLQKAWRKAFSNTYA